MHTDNQPITLQLNDRLSVRLYKDCRPNCLETRALQKGLILLFDGRELVEEGMGFGAPVVKFKDKTFFSSSASCSISKTKEGLNLKKRFVIDSISRKRLGDSIYLDDTLYRIFHLFFEKAYLANTNFFPFFDKIMELRQALKIQTEFVKVPNRGTIEVNYSIRSNSVNVLVDITGLEKAGCEKIFLLNEQGSTFFRRYSDSDGLILIEAQIGAWSEVKTKEAYLIGTGDLVFGLKVRDKSILFRGWERTKGRFSWAGLSYCVSPQQSFFNYAIKFGNCV